MITDDGIPIAVHEMGAPSGDVHLVFAHATGFCGLVWGPVVDALPQPAPPAVLWDFRGHGRSGHPHVPISWWDMERDVRAVVDTTAAARIGVGHSMGGAALIMAELTRPGTFAGLVLVEPIVVPPPFVKAHHPLSELALRRRRTFSSPAAARAGYAAKPPFAAWVPSALDAYLESGLRRVDDGWTLACAPEIEAAVFDAAPAHGTLALLAEADLPITVMVGGAGDTYPVEWGEHLASVSGGTSRVVSDGTHFLPMERPDLVAAEVAAMVDRVGAPPPG